MEPPSDGRNRPATPAGGKGGHRIRGSRKEYAGNDPSGSFRQKFPHSIPDGTTFSMGHPSSGRNERPIRKEPTPGYHLPSGLFQELGFDFDEVADISGVADRVPPTDFGDVPGVPVFGDSIVPKVNAMGIADQHQHRQRPPRKKGAKSNHKGGAHDPSEYAQHRPKQSELDAHHELSQQLFGNSRSFMDTGHAPASASTYVPEPALVQPDPYQSVHSDYAASPHAADFDAYRRSAGRSGEPYRDPFSSATSFESSLPPGLVPDLLAGWDKPEPGHRPDQAPHYSASSPYDSHRDEDIARLRYLEELVRGPSKVPSIPLPPEFSLSRSSHDHYERHRLQPHDDEPPYRRPQLHGQLPDAYAERDRHTINRYALEHQRQHSHDLAKKHQMQQQRQHHMNHHAGASSSWRDRQPAAESSNFRHQYPQQPAPPPPIGLKSASSHQLQQSPSDSKKQAKQKTKKKNKKKGQESTGSGGHFENYKRQMRILDEMSRSAGSSYIRSGFSAPGFVRHDDDDDDHQQPAHPPSAPPHFHSALGLETHPYREHDFDALLMGDGIRPSDQFEFQQARQLKSEKAQRKVWAAMMAHARCDEDSSDAGSISMRSATGPSLSASASVSVSQSRGASCMSDVGMNPTVSESDQGTPGGRSMGMSSAVSASSCAEENLPVRTLDPRAVGLWRTPTLYTVTHVLDPSVFLAPDEYRIMGLGGLNIGNPELRIAVQPPPKRSQGVEAAAFLGSYFAEDVTSTTDLFNILRDACREFPEQLANNTCVCMRLLSCNLAKVLGPNFPRLALSFGIIMYRGMWMVASSQSLDSLAQWIMMIDKMSKRHGERRPRIHILSEAILFDKLGDIAVEVLKAVDMVAVEMHVPTLLPKVDKFTNQDEDHIEACRIHAREMEKKLTEKRKNQNLDGKDGAIKKEDGAGALPKTSDGKESAAISPLETIPEVEQRKIAEEHVEPPSASSPLTGDDPWIAVKSVPESIANEDFDRMRKVREAKQLAEAAVEAIKTKKSNEHEKRPGFDDTVLSSPLAVRPVTSEQIASLGAEKFFQHPGDLREPGVAELYSVSQVEKTDTSETLVVREKSTGKWETRKRIILDVPKAVLIRELWLELCMPPAPAKTVDVLDEEIEHENDILMAEGKSVHIIEFLVNAIPWFCKMFVDIDPNQCVRVYATQDLIVSIAVDKTTRKPEPSSSEPSLLKPLSTFRRMVHLVDLPHGRCSLWISDTAGFACIPDFGFRLVESQFTKSLQARVAARQAAEVGFTSVDCLANPREVIRMLAWQIVECFCDNTFLDSLCQMVDDLAKDYENPNPEALPPPEYRTQDDVFNEYRRSDYRIKCHRKFLDLWFPQLKRIMPMHWQQEIPKKYHKLLRARTGDMIASVAQTSALHRPTLACFDILNFWEIFLDASEEEFGRCLQARKLMYERESNPATKTALNSLPGGFFHVSIPKLEQYGFKDVFIDTSVIPRYVVDGNTLEPGETPPGCDFKVNWVCNDIPGHVLANVYCEHRGIQEIRKHGVLDIRPRDMMERCWLGFMLTPPMEVIEVIDPSLYADEGPNVRYMAVDLKVPWSLKMAAAMDSYHLFRLERFENYIVGHPNTGSYHNVLDPVTGAPDKSQFIKSEIQIASVAVFLQHGDQTFYGAAGPRVSRKSSRRSPNRASGQMIIFFHEHIRNVDDR